MSELIDTVQLQELADSIVQFFEITLPSGTIFYATDALDDIGNIQNNENLYFPTKDGTTLIEYVAIPIQITGLEVTTAGPIPRPKLRAANIATLARSAVNNSDGVEDEETLQNILEAENIARNVDLIGLQVVHRTTLKKYTYREDDVASWTTTLPTEFPTTSWYIDRVSTETELLVEFELSSPVDLEGIKVPNRQVIGKYCPWQYQGLELRGVGGCSWPIDSEGRFFDTDDTVISKSSSPVINAWITSGTYTAGDKVKTVDSTNTALGQTKDFIRIYQAIRNVPRSKDPRKQPSYWTRIDGCGKQLNSCKIRFQGNNDDNVLNAEASLPFGGFPGSRQFK